MKINNSAAEVQMAKRCHIPVIISDKCPVCEHIVEDDLSEGKYLSYPSTNEPFFYDFYCKECGHEWTSIKKIVLRITLEEVE